MSEPKAHRPLLTPNPRVEYSETSPSVYADVSFSKMLSEITTSEIWLAKCLLILEGRILLADDGHLATLKKLFDEICKIKSSENFKKTINEKLEPLEKNLWTIQKALYEKRYTIDDFNPLDASLKEAYEWAKELSDQFNELLLDNEGAKIAKLENHLQLLEVVRKFKLIVLNLEQIRDGISSIKKELGVNPEWVENPLAENFAEKQPHEANSSSVVIPNLITTETPDSLIEVTSTSTNSTESEQTKTPGPSPSPADLRVESLAYKTYTIRERFDSLSQPHQSEILRYLKLSDASQLWERIYQLRNDQLKSKEGCCEFLSKKENLVLLPLLWAIEPNNIDGVLNSRLMNNYYITQLYLNNKHKAGKRYFYISNPEYLAYAQLSALGQPIELTHKRYNFFRADLSHNKLDIDSEMEADFRETDLQASTLYFIRDDGKFDFSKANLTGSTICRIPISVESFNLAGSQLKDTKWVSCALHKTNMTIDQLLSVDYLENCILSVDQINVLTLPQKIQLEQKVMNGLIARQVADLNLIPDIFWNEQDISQVPEGDKDLIIAKYHIAQLLGASYLGCLNNSIAGNSPQKIYKQLDEKFKNRDIKASLQRQLEKIIDQYEHSWWWPLRWLRSLLFSPDERRERHLTTLRRLRDSQEKNLVEMTEALRNIYNEIRQENNWFKSTLLSAVEQSSQALLDSSLEDVAPNRLEEVAINPIHSTSGNKPDIIIEEQTNQKKEEEIDIPLSKKRYKGS